MTTLVRDPNTSGFTLPETLTPAQIAQGYSTIPGPYNALTGQLKTSPSYADLAASSNNNNPVTNFTTSLVQMLKEAQQRNTTGQASLMKQDQGITGLGLNDATKAFSNKMLSPSAGTSLGMSAQNEFDPLNLSIANQQKLAAGNLSNITDLVKQTQDSYDNEQNRIAQAKSDLADAEYKQQVLAETIRSNKADEAYKKSNPTGNGFSAKVSIPEFTKNFESIKSAPYLDPTTNQMVNKHDNYVDPQEWIAARTLWGIHGGSDASFISNFKKYLNPESYDIAGLGTDSGA